jgi:hypothetical protein
LLLLLLRILAMVVIWVLGVEIAAGHVREDAELVVEIHGGVVASS